jgi:hypothetical protein
MIVFRLSSLITRRKLKIMELTQTAYLYRQASIKDMRESAISLATKIRGELFKRYQYIPEGRLFITLTGKFLLEGSTLSSLIIEARPGDRLKGLLDPVTVLCEYLASGETGNIKFSQLRAIGVSYLITSE